MERLVIVTRALKIKRVHRWPEQLSEHQDISFIKLPEPVLHTID